jgi:hypothetical protein
VYVADALAQVRVLPVEVQDFHSSHQHSGPKQRGNHAPRRTLTQWFRPILKSNPDEERDPSDKIHGEASPGAER